MDIDVITKKLQDMSIPKVAAQCGLSFNTVQKVKDGDDSVTLSTLKKLSEYFDARV